MKEPPDLSHISAMIDRLKENWNEMRENWPDAFGYVHNDSGPYVRIPLCRSDFEPLFDLELDDPYLDLWFDYQYVLWKIRSTISGHGR